MIVHEHEGKGVVSIVDPAQILGVVGENAELSAVAPEAGDRLRRVVTALGKEAGGA